VKIWPKIPTSTRPKPTKKKVSGAFFTEGSWRREGRTRKKGKGKEGWGETKEPTYHKKRNSGLLEGRDKAEQKTEWRTNGGERRLEKRGEAEKSNMHRKRKMVSNKRESQRKKKKRG